MTGTGREGGQGVWQCGERGLGAMGTTSLMQTRH